ncbi:hypothetical protein CYLTODRAFT_348068, partial [Cylindrobasidium torrendii FP15055 ss-10]
PNSFHKPSTLKGLEKGVLMEIEVIWGAVVCMARKARVNMPQIETVYALLVVSQNQTLRENDVVR